MYSGVVTALSVTTTISVVGSQRFGSSLRWVSEGAVPCPDRLYFNLVRLSSPPVSALFTRERS